MTDTWDRLCRFAKAIRLESISIGPAQFSFALAREHAPAFAQIRERIASLNDKKTDVFALSAHNVDEVTVIDRIDADHECEALGGPTRFSGGSGANTAYVLAKLGARVRVSGIIGEDENGTRLRHELGEAGVGTELVLVNPELPTGRTTTLVESGGRRFIVVTPGVNSSYAALADEEALLKTALSSKVVHLSSFVGPLELQLQQRLVDKIELQTIVSLSPGALYARQGLDRLEPLLRRVDLMFLYREQLAQLVENSSASMFIRGNRTANLLEAFFRWRKNNDIASPVILVIKDIKETPSGAITERYLSVGAGAERLEKYVAPQQLPKGVDLHAVDTTGSGDAAAAGFIYGMLRSAPLDSCIDFAFLMAAFASTELGPRTAFQSPGSAALLARTTELEARPSMRPTKALKRTPDGTA
jgi:ribokinase